MYSLFKKATIIGRSVWLLSAIWGLILSGCVQLEKDPKKDPTAPGFSFPQISNISIENLQDDTLNSDSVNITFDAASDQVFSFAVGDEPFSSWSGSLQLRDVLDDGTHRVVIRTKFSSDSGGNTIAYDTLHFVVNAIDSATLYLYPRKISAAEKSEFSFSCRINSPGFFSVVSMNFPQLRITSVASAEASVLVDTLQSRISLFSTTPLTTDSTESELATITATLKNAADSVFIHPDSVALTFVDPGGNTAQNATIVFDHTRGSLVLTKGQE